MTDAIVAAEAAPMPEAAVISPTPAGFTPPLGSQIPQNDTPPAQQGQQQQPAPPDAKQTAKSLDEALDRAMQKVKDKAPPPAKDDAKPATDAKPAQPHRENGKFAPDPAKVAQPQQQAAPQEQPAQQPPAAPTAYRDPPARYDDAAKADWEKVPETVRGAAHRAIRELEDGFQKYKGDAEAYHDVREYGDMAKQYGTTLKAALTNYVGIERLLASDPQAGFERIIANMGWKKPDGSPITFREYAAGLLGQTVDQQQSRSDTIITELRGQVETLGRELAGLRQNVTQQGQQATLASIDEFARNHPRFEELGQDVLMFIQNGRARDLAEAYQLAERLNPAPAANAAHTGAVTSPAQTRSTPPLNPAGEKSISGAPSDTVVTAQPRRKPGDPIPSLDESLDRAFRKVGRS